MRPATAKVGDRAEILSGGLSLSAAPWPQLHTLRMRNRERQSPPILDLRLPIFDYRIEAKELQSRYFSVMS